MLYKNNNNNLFVFQLNIFEWLGWILCIYGLMVWWSDGEYGVSEWVWVLSMISNNDVIYVHIWADFYRFFFGARSGSMIERDSPIASSECRALRKTSHFKRFINFIRIFFDSKTKKRKKKMNFSVEFMMILLFFPFLPLCIFFSWTNWKRTA